VLSHRDGASTRERERERERERGTEREGERERREDCSKGRGKRLHAYSGGAL